ncbi:MAG: TlpA family protein disulfide reductase [Deltaproteobacteria bacterium]|nr:TlpA family protein disulfide reductase [Deltaproteobacteria bacterium]
MRLKIALALIFMFCLAPLSWAGITNQKAPDFNLQDLNGKTVTLESLKGKVVFVDFWASWCPPCKKELPELNKLMDKYKDSDVVVAAINVDKNKAQAADFVSKVPNLSKKMVILHDADSLVISAYKAKAMPTSFVLDKNGVIRYVHFGYQETDPFAWVDEINKLLK